MNPFDISPHHYKLPAAKNGQNRKVVSDAMSGDEKSVRRHGPRAVMDRDNLFNGFLSGLPDATSQRKIAARQAAARAVVAKASADDAVAKATADTMYYGPTHPWTVCDSLMGYNIWPSLFPTFLDWVAMPSTAVNRNVIEIPVMDFRGHLSGYGSESGSGDEWCTLNTYTPAVTRGCRLKYCFSQNHFYWTGMQSFTPEDFQEVCFLLPSIQTPEGANIRDNFAFEWYMMLARQRNAALVSTIVDDSQAPEGANEAPEDGLVAWFDNYLDRHPELTGTCEELGPTVIDLTAYNGQDFSAFTDIPEAIADRLWELQDQLENIFTPGQPYLFPQDENFFFTDIALVGNRYDIECILRAQSCVRLCAGQLGVVFNARDLATPEGRRIWETDYNDHLRKGIFGQGYLDLPRGMGKISVIRNSSIPKGGGLFLMIKRLPGYEQGFRLWSKDWNPWRNNYLARFPAASQYVEMLDGKLGSMLFITDTSGGVLCPKANLRWNWLYVSGMPWLQTKFENYDTCDLTSHAFSQFPVTTHATACEQIIVPEVG